MWALRTTPSKITGLSPFALLTGREAGSKLVRSWMGSLDMSKNKRVMVDANRAQDQDKYVSKKETKGVRVSVGDWYQIFVKGEDVLDLRAPGRPAALSSDPQERGYPGGTTGDNLEGEDGGNLEIQIPSETKDGPQRRPASEEEDPEGKERRWRTPATDDGRPRDCKGEERQDEGQEGPRRSVTATSLEGRGSGSEALGNKHPVKAKSKFSHAQL
ncbi:hypothetical protein NDU88_006115 [Pleurodeles waltl]|uniref:Uncharacterized protein n=1 Tax=Pleurodeles waltl TaxID=8319 RepID=A0AAV7LZ95_PLEWA|nr:hypothetical protein NDU88_006115 [Pleurodeles waltl]